MLDLGPTGAILFHPFTSCFLISFATARVTGLGLDAIQSIFMGPPSEMEIAIESTLDLAFVAISCYLFPPAAFANAASGAVAVNLTAALGRASTIGSASQGVTLLGSHVFAYATSGTSGSSGIGGSKGSGAPRTAVDAADEALAAGKTRGAASQLEVSGYRFTDVSGAKANLDPRVQKALDSVPPAERAPWHGKCAEVGCVDQAFKAGVDPEGGTSIAVNIGKSGTGHGTFKEACTSCRRMLEFLGVKF